MHTCWRRTSFLGARQQKKKVFLNASSPRMKLPGRGMSEFGEKPNNAVNYAPAALDAASLRQLLWRYKSGCCYLRYKRDLISVGLAVSAKFLHLITWFVFGWVQDSLGATGQS